MTGSTSSLIVACQSDNHVPGAGRTDPEELMARLHRLAPGDASRAAARARVIDWYLPMSVYLARRFDGRGEPLADLTQVAAIGLIKAVDRYDATRGVPFASYAIRTIVAEINRHFRDAGRTVRVRSIDALSGPDPGIDAVDRRETLRRALAALPVRERRVIGLRFVGGMTQAQIAERIGVSQMHVSRLLRDSLTRLRDAMQTGVGQHSPDGSAMRSQGAA